jgi:hypothetical protein
MAYLRRRIVAGGTYIYIVESRRVGARVRQKTLEYLGRNPDPERLKRALEYWQVGKERNRKKNPRRR